MKQNLNNPDFSNIFATFYFNRNFCNFVATILTKNKKILDNLSYEIMQLVFPVFNHQ